jgi:hypothetical protein
MGGGLMQLVAYGAQDIYLSGNPQITLFKIVYRRHSNFAMESIEQTFNGHVDLGKTVTATISRNGDLIKDMWLEVEFSSTNLENAVYGLGNALVKEVRLEVGGQLVDRQYGEWMNIWSELTLPEGKRVGYDEMVGNVCVRSGGKPQTRLDVPLFFWFNRNPGLSLPLIALQYHEVKLTLEIENAKNLSKTTLSDEYVSLSYLKLWVDYIYLDTDERRRFAQVSHEYLIEQVQFTGDVTLSQGTTCRTSLSYNHPCKQLIWVAQSSAQGRNNGGADVDPCKFQALHGDGQVSHAKLQLNGHERFNERRLEYFTRVQTYKHHTHMPRANRELALKVMLDTDTDTNFGDVLGENNSSHLKEDNAQYIYTYSFALTPEEHQPSGTCNFSRIDNAHLVLTNPRALSGNLKIFTVNYNVLRIMSGMGGLAYSN